VLLLPFKQPYAKRIIALLASAAGKETTKSPFVEVLSPPKEMTATALVVLEPPSVVVL
jgi:hypothetical protein